MMIITMMMIIILMDDNDYNHDIMMKRIPMKIKMMIMISL